MRRLWAIALIVLAALAMPVGAQTIMERLVTPGPLSRSHANLEARCDACHTSFKKEAQNGKCLGCHQGIAGDIRTRTGFHSRFAPARNGACKSCHSEHKGRNAALKSLNRSGFDHAGLTDEPLSGAHARAACSGCHAPGAQFRGTTRNCASCHARVDPHKGQLSQCATCHTTAAWKPAKAFDHSGTGFSLSGGHRQISCASCHAGQRWKGLGRTCAACHARDDPHGGSRGSNCASCHSTASWASATFDHSSTGFPLAGAHAGAACAGCHGKGNAVKHPPRTCAACHAADDVHHGANGTNCASCHSSRAWKAVSFDHDTMTGFPLRGEHRLAACAACHKQPAREVKLPVACVACHLADDSHKGANGPDCERCHSEKGWKETTFNHNTMTRFPLAGGHALARCADCHVGPGAPGKLATECSSCHAARDVHQGALGKDCATCHGVASWKEGIVFDHDLTRFPLLGGHAGAVCTACHADRQFTAKGLACADCHIDDHHKGALGQPAPCAMCHNTTDWKGWTFDHDVQTGFRLEGAHRGLICSACHARPGKPADLGAACIDCHRRDDVHRGGFGEDCARCHTVSTFREVVMKRR